MPRFKTTTTTSHRDVVYLKKNNISDTHERPEDYYHAGAGGNRLQQNNINNDNHKPKQTLPTHLLNRIANDLLDHIKEFGLFDEIRMKLMESIESSGEFVKVKSQFKRDVDLFCSKANLGLSRAILREKLTPKMLYKSAAKLEEHVYEISKQKRNEFKALYNEQARNYLKTIQTATREKSLIPLERQKSHQSSATSGQESQEEDGEESGQFRIEVETISHFCSNDVAIKDEHKINPIVMEVKEEEKKEKEKKKTKTKKKKRKWRGNKAKKRNKNKNTELYRTRKQRSDKNRIRRRRLMNDEKDNNEQRNNYFLSARSNGANMQTISLGK